MSKHLTVRGGLALIMLVYTLLLLMISIIGIQSVRQINQRLAVVNQVQAEELSPLAASFNATLRARTAGALSVRQMEMGKLAAADDSRQRAEKLIGEADASMQKFTDLKKLTPRGAQLSAELENTYQIYVNQALRPMLQALKTNDSAAYYALLEDQLRNLSANFDQDLRDFRGFADEVGQKALSDAQHDYQRDLIIISVSFAFSLLIGALCWVALRKIILNPLESVDGHVSLIASGDLSQDLESEGKSEIAKLGRRVLTMQTSLADTVSQVRDASMQVDVGAKELTVGNRNLSQHTEELAASLEETAASMEQLTATGKQNADNAEQANQLAGNVSHTADKGAEIVSEAIARMQGISTSSQKIADIISVIDGIAFQTNILALNAAVEAARAGEQGRGFAVVASEVRNLAQRSASAAKEIKVLIDDSVSKVDNGTQLVAKAGATMAEVVSSVKNVTDIVGEISIASHEQSTGIEEINKAITQMDEVTQQNAALVQEASSAAYSLNEQAERLAESISIFKVSAAAVNTALRQPSPLKRPALLSGRARLPADKTDEGSWETF